MEKKTIKQTKAKKKTVKAEAVEAKAPKMTVVLDEPKKDASGASKADTMSVTLWVKRVTKPGEAESTWRIRGSFDSKADAEAAFKKLNGDSGMYESKVE